MATVTLAPTDNWQSAMRDHDGYGSIILHSGGVYNGNGGITFKAPKVDIRTTDTEPATVNGYWVATNTATTLRNLNYIPAPGKLLFYFNYGGLELVDPQVTIPPTHPQISMLVSINKGGFGITASARDALFDCGDRLTTQVFDIDTCGFKFAASSTASRIRTKVTNNAIGMIFDASTGKASGLHFEGQGRKGAGIEARRGSRITLSGDIRTAGLDIGMRAQHNSTIWLDSGTIEDCYQGLREEGGRILARSAVVFNNNATDRITVPVDAV